MSQTHYVSASLAQASKVILYSIALTNVIRHFSSHSDLEFFEIESQMV